MTQAATISNLIYQTSVEIDRQLASINNTRKVLNYQGREFVKQEGVALPSNVVDLLKHKAKLHATQAFLMENVKAKDALINDLKSERYISKLDVPEVPTYERLVLLPNVDEQYWGVQQLSVEETNEWIEQEAIAAHVGQFFHKGGVLDRLRNELPRIETLQWESVQDGVGVKNFPLTITVHHKPEDLLKLHEELSGIHRAAEQRVNYFKAKVKNLVTEENARIARVNQDEAGRVNRINNELRDKYAKETKAYNELYQTEEQKFNAEQFDKIKKTHSLKITIDPRFQETINEFLAKLETK